MNEASEMIEPTSVIEANEGWRTLQLSKVWAYRELLFFLAWRDVKVRYKQSSLGAGWVIVQPLATLGIFTLVFGRLLELHTDDVPYPAFVLVGLLGWNYFTSTVGRMSNSLIQNSNLLTKVYFPRLVVPLASAGAGLVDLLVTLLAGLFLLAWLGIRPMWMWLTLPLGILFLLAISLGVGLWLAALNVRYRDVGQMTPFLLQIWLYATPIIYHWQILPTQWQGLVWLNPMAGVSTFLRWSLLGSPLPLAAVGSVCLGLLMLVVGFYFFRSVERHFADIV